MVKLFLSLFLIQCCIADDSEARAKAALALAAKSNICHCRDDLDKCREDSKKTGKPLIIGVNIDCKATAKKVPWAIYCKVASYTADGRPSTEPRYVILSPDKVNTDLYIRATLNKEVTSELLKTAIKEATKVQPPLPKINLNWS